MADYDSARVFLAKWAAGVADQSEKAESFDQRYRHVGIWGHDDWEEETALGVFEVLNVSNPSVTRKVIVRNMNLLTCMQKVRQRKFHPRAYKDVACITGTMERVL